MGHPSHLSLSNVVPKAYTEMVKLVDTSARLPTKRSEKSRLVNVNRTEKLLDHGSAAAQ